MVKSNKSPSSEQKIIEAAKKIFLQKGMYGARMQEIAEEAGINKALLHYYFRSKGQLFKSIFDTAFMNFGPKLFGIFNDDTSMEQKIDDFVNAYLDTISKNPYLPLFIINEIQRNPELLKDVEKVLQHIGKTKIIDELNAGIEGGKFLPIKPEQFFSNIMAWCIFPFLTRPILDRIFGISETAFADFIEERKKIIPSMIMRSIKK
jgi:AcrR family transcriptional regulator